MISTILCHEIFKDLSHLQLSRQKTPDDTLSLEQIRPIAQKVINLFQKLRIGHNDETRVVFKHLVYPLAKEIMRQNIYDLDDLIKEASDLDEKEILEAKKQFFEGSTKTSWELFAAILGIKVQSNAEKFKLFKTLTLVWDAFPELQK